MTDRTAPTRKPGFFWPVGPWVFLAAGLIVFCVTFGRTAKELAWPYQEWAHTNILLEQQALDFTGPLVAAFGALLSGRLSPSRRLYALPRFPRDTAQYLAQSLVPAALVVTAGYLLGVIPILVETFHTATADSLATAALGRGVLVVNALLVVGWLVGLLMQSAFAAPIVFAAGFAASVVGYAIGAWNTVTPVLSSTGGPGREMSLTFALFRTSFFVVVMIATLITASLVLTGRGFDRRVPARLLLPLLLPAVLAVGAVARPPAAETLQADPPRLCQQAVGLEFCMHRAHQRDLRSLVERVEPIVTLVGQQNLPFNRVYDWALSDGTSPPADPTVFYADASPEWGLSDVRSQIASLVAGSEACATKPGGEESAAGLNSFTLFLYLAGQNSDSGNPFRELTGPQLRQWLSENRTALARCEVTDEMLP